MEVVLKRLEDIEDLLRAKPSKNTIFTDKDPNFKNMPKFDGDNLITYDSVSSRISNFVTSSTVTTMISTANSILSSSLSNLFYTKSAVDTMLSNVSQRYAYFYNDGYSPQTCATNNYVNFGSLINHDNASATQDTLTRVKVNSTGTYLVNYNIFYNAEVVSTLSFATDNGGDSPVILIVGGEDDTTGIITQVGSNLIAAYQIVLELEENDGIQIKNVGSTITIKKCQLTILKLA